MPDHPLHKCRTKATTAEGDNVRHSLSWVFSRRAILQVWPDRLVCGDWAIPYSEIEEAVLFETRANFIIPCYVLRVKVGFSIYQFGLNPSSFWKGELPFAVTRESMRAQFSPFSVGVRVALIGYVIYLIWMRFS